MPSFRFPRASVRALALVLVLVLAGCADSKPIELMGNTNWLHCEDDAECESGLCACGVCTQTCETLDDCASLLDARCELDVGAACGEDHADAPGVCLPEADAEADAGVDAGAAADAGVRRDGADAGTLVGEGSRADAGASPDAGPSLVDSGPPLPACEYPSVVRREARVYDSDTGRVLGDAALEGNVLAQGTGVPGDLAVPPLAFTSEAVWLRVEAADRTWTLIEEGVGPLPALTTGDAVRVRLADQGEGLNLSYVRVVIERGDEVLQYYERGGALVGLMPPAPFTLDPDAKLCGVTDSCGEIFDVEAQLADGSGHEVTLAPGDAVSFAGYRVVYAAGSHARAALLAPDVVACPDWTPADVELVMTAE